MAERMLCIIWCDECCERHWELTNRLGEAGRAVSKSGTLKVALRCESCRRDLVRGEEATAITIDGGIDSVPWEDGYIDIDPSSVSLGREAEGVWERE